MAEVVPYHILKPASVHRSKLAPAITAMGQTETLGGALAWSVHPPTTDMSDWRQQVG